MTIADEIQTAEQRIRPFIRQTYLDHSPFFSALTGAEVYFKQENLQYTGSFKVRGAFNKLLALPEADRNRGVVTASSGNHGAAIAYALGKIDASGLVFVPHDAAPTKVEAIKQLGAGVRYHGEDCIETENYARHYAAERQLAYVPPYNDYQVIAGQGTIGIELQQQLPRFDAVFVALGGGGLVSGIAAYLKAQSPSPPGSTPKIIACSPDNSKVMIESVRAGKIVDLPSLPTLSDGTAGGVEADTVTFPLVRDLVDDYMTVSENEIRVALQQYIAQQQQLIEGAAAMTLASFLRHSADYRGQRVVIVLCGANIGLEVLRQNL